MTASQEALQQRRPATDGALDGVALAVRVVGDHALISLEFIPVDIAFVPIMQQDTPFLAWQTHSIANTPAAVFQLCLPTVAAVGMGARINRVGQHVEKTAVIPAARRADWYARGVGGAAACEINRIPAARPPGQSQDFGSLV
jgi:hypothetical protein